jgi:hypothetical protein
LIAPLLFAAVLAAPPDDYRRRFPLPDLTAPSGWGVNIHFTDPAPGEIEKLAQSGFKWIRMDFAWVGIERETGHYEFAAYDRLMAGLRGANVRPILILDYGNDLYQKGSPRSPEARAAFCRFVSASVRHFGGQGIVWEMWNEPNGGFWQPKANVGEYIDLAREVGETIRQTAPQEWFIGPGVSGFDWTFVQACIDAGLLRYWDAVSVHPYRGSEPETVADDWRRLRGMIGAKAAPGKQIPMISSEWGYTDIASGIGIDRQADFVVRQYLSNLIAGVPLSIVYDWKNDGTSPTDGESHFGTQTFDLQPKPAYLAVQRLSQQLSGYTYRMRLAQASDDAYVLAFTRGNTAKYVAWTTSREPRTTNLQLGKDSVTKALTERPVVWTSTDPAFVLASHPLPDIVDIQNPGQTLRLVRRVRDSVDPSKLDHPGYRVLLCTRGQNGGTEEELDPMHPDDAARNVAARIDGDWSAAPRILELRVAINSGRDVVRRVKCVQTNPVSVDLVASGDGAWAVIHNPGRRRIAMMATPKGVRLAPLISVPVNAAKDQTVKLGGPIQFAPGAPLDVRIYPALAANGPAAVTLRDQVATPVDQLSSSNLTQDGDPKLHATTALLPYRELADSLNGAHGCCIRYQFPPGWKFLELHPATELRSSGPAQLNMFVVGDASGDALRMRFTDSTGQTFQPTFGSIDWTGSKFISFKLDGSDSGHWGGANDGIVHFPIRVDTLVLIDSAGNPGKPREISVEGITLVSHG